MVDEQPGERWNRRYAEERWPDQPDDLLVARAAGLPAGHAVDLACGPGRNAVHLARLGWTVTGIDASSVGLAQAAARAGAAGVQVELVEADVRDWRPVAGGVDLVVVANLHLPPGTREPFFARIVAALAPGGHALVVGHHPDSPGCHGSLGAERGYTAELLATLLAPCRLEVHHVHRPGRDGRGPSHRLAAWATLPGTPGTLC